MNRSRARRRLFAWMRYEARCCQVAGGAEYARPHWGYARAGAPFYRNEATFPYGWHVRMWWYADEVAINR